MRDKLRLRMLFMHEYRLAESDTAVQGFLRSCIVQTLILIALMIVLAVVGDFGLILSTISILLPLLYPFLLVKRLDRDIARRKLQLLLELPVFVNKLLLLLQSGLTLHATMLRLTDAYSDEDAHPFARHMAIAAKQLKNAVPFAQVMEDLARRCATQEVTYFTSAVLMNYRRGGEELAASLRTLSRELWDKRKTAVKTLGEEASAKMIFPLIVVFMTVMIAVGAPAIMQINQ